MRRFKYVNPERVDHDNDDDDQSIDSYMNVTAQSDDDVEAARRGVLGEDERAALVVPYLASRAYHIPGNTVFQDWFQFVYANNHPVWGLCCHDRHHPVTNGARILVLLGTFSASLAVFNFFYLYFLWEDKKMLDTMVVSTNFTNKIDDDYLEYFVVKAASVQLWQIYLWTFGSLIVSIFNMSIWTVAACAMFAPGGRFAKWSNLRFIGQVLVFVLVFAVALVAVLLVVYRANVERDTVIEKNLEGVFDQLDLKPALQPQGNFYLKSWAIQFTITIFLYDPILSTLLFSGILACGADLPILGGRPYEMRMAALKRRRSQWKSQRGSAALFDKSQSLIRNQWNHESSHSDEEAQILSTERRKRKSYRDGLLKDEITKSTRKNLIEEQKKSLRRSIRKSKYPDFGFPMAFRLECQENFANKSSTEAEKDLVSEGANDSSSSGSGDQDSGNQRGRKKKRNEKSSLKVDREVRRSQRRSLQKPVTVDNSDIVTGRRRRRRSVSKASHSSSMDTQLVDENSSDSTYSDEMALDYSKQRRRRKQERHVMEKDENPKMQKSSVKVDREARLSLRRSLQKSVSVDDPIITSVRRVSQVKTPDDSTMDVKLADDNSSDSTYSDAERSKQRRRRRQEHHGVVKNERTKRKKSTLVMEKDDKKSQRRSLQKSLTADNPDIASLRRGSDLKTQYDSTNDRHLMNDDSSESTYSDAEAQVSGTQRQIKEKKRRGLVKGEIPVSQESSLRIEKKTKKSQRRSLQKSIVVTADHRGIVTGRSGNEMSPLPNSSMNKHLNDDESVESIRSHAEAQNSSKQSRRKEKKRHRSAKDEIPISQESGSKMEKEDRKSLRRSLQKSVVVAADNPDIIAGRSGNEMKTAHDSTMDKHLMDSKSVEAIYSHVEAQESVKPRQRKEKKQRGVVKGELARSQESRVNQEKDDKKSLRHSLQKSGVVTADNPDIVAGRSGNEVKTPHDSTMEKHLMDTTSVEAILPRAEAHDAAKPRRRKEKKRRGLVQDEIPLIQESSLKMENEDKKSQQALLKRSAIATANNPHIISGRSGNEMKTPSDSTNDRHLMDNRSVEAILPRAEAHDAAKPRQRKVKKSLGLDKGEIPVSQEAVLKTEKGGKTLQQDLLQKSEIVTTENPNIVSGKSGNEMKTPSDSTNDRHLMDNRSVEAILPRAEPHDADKPRQRKEKKNLGLDTGEIPASQEADLKTEKGGKTLQQELLQKSEIVTTENPNIVSGKSRNEMKTAHDASMDNKSVEAIRLHTVAQGSEDKPLGLGKGEIPASQEADLKTEKGGKTLQQDLLQKSEIVTTENPSIVSSKSGNEMKTSHDTTTDKDLMDNKPVESIHSHAEAQVSAESRQGLEMK